MDGGVVSGRKRRVFRRVEEKLRIVKLTLEQGATVAGITLANGVSANQVFRWKRQYERGELKPRGSKSAAAIILVMIPAEPEASKVVEFSIPPPAHWTGRRTTSQQPPPSPALFVSAS